MAQTTDGKPARPAKRKDSPHKRRNAERVADELARARTAPEPSRATHLATDSENGSQIGPPAATRASERLPLQPDGSPWDPRWKPPKGPTAYFRARGEAYAAVVDELAHAGDAPASVRLQAATYAIDRIEGKATQAVALAVGVVNAPPDGDSIDALARLMVAGDDENT